MEQYDRLYRLYAEFDTGRLRDHQAFVDLFPPLDSRVALEHWETVSKELAEQKAGIVDSFAADAPRSLATRPDVAAISDDAAATYAEIAARASRDQAFTALDLLSTYDRPVNVLVLDVDETLRSAGSTDNEIPRETLHLLTEFHEMGVPIVVCTGQTLENVKGFLIQGLGSELVHSGELSIVYESGNGVFTPGHGADSKRLLYEDLDETVVAIFEGVRSRLFRDASADLRRGSHLQGNEFNVTVKPNAATGSDRARELIDDALVHQLDVLGAVAAETVADEAVDSAAGGTDADEVGANGIGADEAGEWARAAYAAADPEIRAVLESRDAVPDRDLADAPPALTAVFERIDVAYYEADAAELTSRELTKPDGVAAAYDVLGIDDPFALVMGDSKTDLRIMEWVDAAGTGIAAAPEHASPDVLEHVRSTDDLVFDRGDAASVLRIAYALDRLAELEAS
ncbi:HAD hydrolase family protein [Salinarchaeum chitinilyticum]